MTETPDASSTQRPGAVPARLALMLAALVSGCGTGSGGGATATPGGDTAAPAPMPPDPASGLPGMPGNPAASGRGPATPPK